MAPFPRQTRFDGGDHPDSDGQPIAESTLQFDHDPETNSLEGWRREGGELRKFAEVRGDVSPLLGIRFDPGEGPDNMRIYGNDGRRFRNHLKVLDDPRAWEHRADVATQRADAARQRAEAERRRADRLAARLCELGESMN